MASSWPMAQPASTLREIRTRLGLSQAKGHRTTGNAFQREVGLRTSDAFASRAAGEQFVAKHYRCFSGQEVCSDPLPTVPDDYDRRLRTLRRRRRMTQADLAAQIGAAGKAVIYQWESRKRTPSPVF